MVLYISEVGIGSPATKMEMKWGPIPNNCLIGGFSCADKSESHCGFVMTLLIRLALKTINIKHANGYTGWWLSHPSEKYEFVSWDESSQHMEIHKSHVPNHQSDHLLEQTLLRIPSRSYMGRCLERSIPGIRYIPTKKPVKSC